MRNPQHNDGTLLSERMNLIQDSPTLALTALVNEKRAAGEDIIGLGAGEPDFNTPENICLKAKEAIDAGKTKYTPVAGITELRNAICDKFQKDNHLTYKTNQIIVSVGGKQVLFNALLASVNPGNEVIIPAPYWTSYPEMVSFCGGNSIIVPTTSETGYKITAAQLEASITPKTKWFILNSPNNPTGAVYTESELQDLATVLLHHPNVNILTDDIYEHLVYGVKFANIVQVEPSLQSRTLIVGGVSKAYSMTGWRIGYGAGSQELVKAMSKIQSQSTSNPCSISQYAALEALSGTQDFIPENNQLFVKRRDLVLEQINSTNGLSAITPEGAFYIFVSCEGLIGKHSKNGKTINDDSDFAAYLLEYYGVAVVPGIAFGCVNHFRISYATSEEKLKEACARIKRACADFAS